MMWWSPPKQVGMWTASVRNLELLSVYCAYCWKTLDKLGSVKTDVGFLVNCQQQNESSRRMRELTGCRGYTQQ